MVLPFKTMDYDNDRFDTLSDVSLNNLSIGDLIKYDGNNFTNVAPTYLDGAGISDNRVIKIVNGSAAGTNMIETSVEGVSTSLKTYIPLTGPLSLLAGSIETEIFDTLKKRMHLTTSSIVNTKGITITSDGRVGVGVIAPEEDFEVDGNIQLDTGGVQRGRVKFYDKQNNHDHSEIDGLGEGTNGGVLALYTKIDGGSVTEKLRINNAGAIGIGGANYGNSGQVIASNGSGNPVSWVDPPVTTYTAGTGVSINGSNQISIGQSVGTSDNVQFNQVQTPTILYDNKFSTDYKIIERSGGVALPSGQNTTVATILTNTEGNAWRSVEVFFEESHTPANGGGKGGNLWIGCFTYKFDSDGNRNVSPQAFFTQNGHGGGISIGFDSIINPGAASGARIVIFNFQAQTNYMRYQFRLYSSTDVLQIS